MKPSTPKPRVIQAIDAVQCIRSHMDDASIMEKFNLTIRGLQDLFEQLVAARAVTQAEIDNRAGLSPGSVIVDIGEKSGTNHRRTVRVIDAREALGSLKTGLSDSLIMKRFNISARGLQDLFKQLQEAGLLRRPFLNKRAAANGATEIERAAAENNSGTYQDDLEERMSMSAFGVSTPSVPQLSAIFEVSHRISSEVIYAGEARSLGDLVCQAVAEKVDLSYAELSHTNLARLDLSGAQFECANLTKSNLAGTDLTAADLSGAVLSSADLFAAVLYKTNFSAANLSGANLGMTYAVSASFSGANMAEADLTRANLCDADLTGAVLFEAIMEHANLKGASLPDARLDFTRGTPLESYIELK